MPRFNSRNEIENVTRGLKDSGDRTANEGQAVSEDAEQISEIYTAQYDAPTAEDANRIAELQRQVRQRVEATMSEVQNEQDRLESEMHQESGERQRAATEQQTNEQQYQKLYGLNKDYDSAAVDQIMALTRESIDFQLNQREQTEQAQAALSEEMSQAISRMRSAFGRLLG